MKFEIREEHLKLLKRMHVTYWDCEYGSPAIDPKRPYGNSDVEEDIAEILDWSIHENGLVFTQRVKAQKIHKEMKTVLQICLSTLSFKEGIYSTTSEYDSTSWKLIKQL